MTMNSNFLISKRTVRGPQKYVADKVKTSCAGDDGRLFFDMSVGEVRERMARGTSVTFIAMDVEWEGVLTVWFFFGPEALDMLSRFNARKKFKMMLSPTQKPSSEFYVELDKPRWRYDLKGRVDVDGTVIVAEKECERLKDAKIAFATSPESRHETQEFWNSQPAVSPNHKAEKKVKKFVADFL